MAVTIQSKHAKFSLTSPPFPDDVPTCPLIRVSLARLLDRDPGEEDKLWTACCNIGFFYIDLSNTTPNYSDQTWQSRPIIHAEDNANKIELAYTNGEWLLEDADKLFEVQRNFFDLPLEEKVRYDFKTKGSFFGYKGYGAGIIDKSNTPDRNEFYNISKDDIFGQGLPLPAPDMLTAYRPLLTSFIKQSHALVTLILDILNDRLGLPNGKLAELHQLNFESGDQVRFIKTPPQPPDDRRVSFGEHTDFGSVTVLFNSLGGLQVLLPKHLQPVYPKHATVAATKELRDDDRWTYVRPLPGHAIVNLGDAIVKLTAGILRSNLHRVASPPGPQACCTRFSLVYFARPRDDAVLLPLKGSRMIEERERTVDNSEEEEVITAKEWILRRGLGRRTGGNWDASIGTEVQIQNV